MHHLLAAAENSQATAPPAFQVSPNLPVLYFGNLAAYENSDLRIITVALNPSNVEFPSFARYSRFPALASYSRGLPQAQRFSILKSAYDAYFDIDPYMRWFGNLEQVLSGFSASYRKGAARTALHTDLMSPVPTNPTWSKLKAAPQATLSKAGVPLWHELIEFLCPDLMLVSVARRNFQRISFPVESTGSNSKAFAGKFRYPLSSHAVRLQSGKLTDVIFTRPAQVPFGFLSHSEKSQIASMFSGQLVNW